VSLLLSQLFHDGLWLATCMLAVAAIFAALTGAAYLAAKIVSAYRAKTRRAMADQHHAPPYAHRQPGAALAAVDDRAIWEAASLTLPPHQAGRITRRRGARRRLQRDLALLLCHAAAYRPRDDA